MMSAVRQDMTQVATIIRTEAGPLSPIGTPTPGATVTLDIPCRAWVEDQSEIAGDGKWHTWTTWKMRIPLDADIRRHDEVEIDGVRFVVDTFVARAFHQVVESEGVRGAA